MKRSPGDKHSRGKGLMDLGVGGTARRLLQLVAARKGESGVRQDGPGEKRRTKERW